MSAVWSRLLAATWVLVAVAHGFVSVASRHTGKPLWWVDNNGVIGGATPVIGAAVLYLAMLAAFVIAIQRVHWAPFASATVSLGLVVSALIDVSAAPGSAAVALATAGAALLASAAALAGRTTAH